MQILPLMSHKLLWKAQSQLTPNTHPSFYMRIPVCVCIQMTIHTLTQCLLFGWLLFVCVFFFLLRDNWAAMTAAFPPNGRGQINLPVLMSANGTGLFLPLQCSTNLLWVSLNEWMCQVEAFIYTCQLWLWIQFVLFTSGSANSSK